MDEKNTSCPSQTSEGRVDTIPQDGVDLESRNKLQGDESKTEVDLNSNIMLAHVETGPEEQFRIRTRVPSGNFDQGTKEMLARQLGSPRYASSDRDSSSENLSLKNSDSGNHDDSVAAGSVDRLNVKVKKFRKTKTSTGDDNRYESTEESGNESPLEDLDETGKGACSVKSWMRAPCSNRPSSPEYGSSGYDTAVHEDNVIQRQKSSHSRRSLGNENLENIEEQTVTLPDTIEDHAIGPKDFNELFEFRTCRHGSVAGKQYAADYEKARKNKTLSLLREVAVELQRLKDASDGQESIYQRKSFTYPEELLGGLCSILYPDEPWKPQDEENEFFTRHCLRRSFKGAELASQYEAFRDVENGLVLKLAAVELEKLVTDHCQEPAPGFVRKRFMYPDSEDEEEPIPSVEETPDEYPYRRELHSSFECEDVTVTYENNRKVKNQFLLREVVKNLEDLACDGNDGLESVYERPKFEYSDSEDDHEEAEDIEGSNELWSKFTRTDSEPEQKLTLVDLEKVPEKEKPQQDGDFYQPNVSRKVLLRSFVPEELRKRYDAYKYKSICVHLLADLEPETCNTSRKRTQSLCARDEFNHSHWTGKRPPGLQRLQSREGLGSIQQFSSQYHEDYTKPEFLSSENGKTSELKERSSSPCKERTPVFVREEYGFPDSREDEDIQPSVDEELGVFQPSVSRRILLQSFATEDLGKEHEDYKDNKNICIEILAAMKSEISAIGSRRTGSLCDRKEFNFSQSNERRLQQLEKTKELENVELFSSRHCLHSSFESRKITAKYEDYRMDKNVNVLRLAASELEKLYPVPSEEPTPEYPRKDYQYPDSEDDIQTSMDEGSSKEQLFNTRSCLNCSFTSPKLNEEYEKCRKVKFDAAFESGKFYFDETKLSVEKKAALLVSDELVSSWSTGILLDGPAEEGSDVEEENCAVKDHDSCPPGTLRGFETIAVMSDALPVSCI